MRLRPQRRALVFRAAGAGALLVLAAVCRAELPPLTPEEQQARSTLIVIGKVRSISHRTFAPKDSPGFLNDEATASVTVEEVLKGKGVRPGQTIRVRYWRAKKRPEHWAGPGGQYQPLKVGAKVRLFLKEGHHGLDLLIPNGWESLGKAPGPADTSP